MKSKHAPKFLLVLATIGFTGHSALAQKQTPPPGGPPKPFTVPANEAYTLPNGMRVTLIPYGNIPKVTLSLAMATGNLNEPKNKNSIADITGNLMKEGTASLSAQALAESAARMGSTLSIGVGLDQSTLEMDVLEEFGPDAVKLIADVVEHPRLPESEFSRLQTDMLRKLALQKSQPQTIAEARFRKILYGDHPYGELLPPEENVQKLTIADAKAFYAANFGAARAHLYVAGKFNVAAMKKAIETSFSGWAKGPGRVENVPTVKPQHVLDVTDRPGAPQSTIIVGLPAPGPTSGDWVPLSVTNTLLGGSFGSRITSNIREQKGYTYSPFGQLSRRYHDAYWAEQADVTTQYTGPSLKEIFGEIDRLQKEAPPDAELKGIQNYISGLFIIQNSTRQALIGQLQYVDLQGLGVDYLKTYVQKVNAVTPAEVRKMTTQYLKPEQMTIVVLGDKSKISDQLTPFNPAPAAQK
jgi:predicted Zn-dependent peptidase